MPPAVQELINEANQLHAANRTFSVTGPDAGQCTAIPHRLSQLTGNPIVYGNAKDTFANAPDSSYGKVLNAPNNFPPVGAIVVWDGSWGAGYGHTAVAVDGCSINTLRVLEENDGDNGLPHIGVHDYAGVIGWYIPKNLQAQAPATATSEVDKPTQDNEGVVNGQGLRGHSQPTQTSPYPWVFDDNEHITLVARTQSETPNSGPYKPSPWWYLAHGNDDNAKNAGYPQVWVSDEFVRTTHNPANVPDYAQPRAVPAEPQYSPRSASGQLIVDISSVGQTHGIDFNALKGAVDGVIIRAGHIGKSFGGLQPDNTDPKLHEFTVAALEVGLPVGFYWFCYPSLDPKAEAQAFVNSVGKLADGESLWADIETDPQDGDHDLVGWSKTFKSEVERLTGRTLRGYFNTSFNNKYPGLQEVFGADGIWGASYNGKPTEPPFPNVAIHQYASDGKLPGIPDKVDLSCILGDKKLADFDTRIADNSNDKGDTSVPEVGVPGVQPVADVKPGVKTTEFWINVLVQLGALITIASQTATNTPGSVWVKVVAVLAAVLSSLGYTSARAQVKSAVAQANSTLSQ